MAREIFAIFAALREIFTFRNKNLLALGLDSAMLVDELHTYLFDGQPHLLAEPMATWLSTSRRFANFAEAFHDKIRKKIRTTQGTEILLGLQLELETADWLQLNRCEARGYMIKLFDSVSLIEKWV